MTPHKTAKMRIKIYSPDQIRSMREYLKETREEFADRFFLTYETIKGWELGRRNVSGPALVILQQIEGVIERQKEDSMKNLALYRQQIRAKKKPYLPQIDKASS